ncbi:hypothetical protein T265_05218 [Opisthorchis viverrini]|uniref:Uncharacterized protein n=1 Tax=Opisthorchis viverrini TaxID=6198 RepID=A0A074ZL50_OPIVI|nr:hypothetical protein T265_05218 [Opisthorchis viverrini]KER27791.1 hypothetical protein T265_05218 [Opisthorchis viverrini]
MLSAATSPSRTMHSESSLLMYLEIPPDCRDAVPLLDLRLPHFSKLMKRVMKKMDRGHDSVDRNLQQLTASGELEDSPFKIIAKKDPGPLDLLFARLPGANGQHEVYQLPFVHLLVRRTEDCSDQCSSRVYCSSRQDVLKSTPSKSEPERSHLEDTLREFAQKLEHIGSSLEALTAPKKPVPRISSTVRKRIKPDTTSLEVPSSFSPLKPLNQLPGSPPKTNPSAVVRRSALEPDLHFQHKLDRTINRVLGRVNRQKSVPSITDLENKFKMELNQLAIPTEVGMDVVENELFTSSAISESNRKKKRKRNRGRDSDSFGNSFQSPVELDSDC